MSETYGATLETNDASAPYESYVEPAVDPYVTELEGFSREQLFAFAQELDALVGPIVATNADTLVCCERLGGVEMTLGQAINAIWPVSDKGAMIREGVSSVVAEIQRLLLNRVLEPEEPEGGESKEAREEESSKEQDALEKELAQEQEAMSKEAAKTESKQTQKNNLLTKTQKELVAHVHKSEYSAGNAGRQEKSPGAQDRSVPITKADQAASSIKGGVTRSVAEAAKVETSADVVSIYRSRITEAPKTKNSTPKDSKQETIGDIIDQELISEAFVEEEKLSQSKLDLELEAEADRQEPILKIPERDALEEVPILEVTVGDSVELTAQEVEPLSADLNSNMEAEDLVDLEEVELESIEEYLDLLVAEINENSLGTEEDEVPEAVNEFSEQTEAIVPEQFVQASLHVEEAEDLLVELAEFINTSDPQTNELMNETLDKIIEASATHDGETEENVFAEPEVQEELEELFIELFTNAGIDYTPELIESLVYLTIKCNLADEIQKLKKGAELEGASQGSGTHELIKKLLVGISIIKKAITHAGTIGRSAIQLYSLSLATNATILN